MDSLTFLFRNYPFNFTSIITHKIQECKIMVGIELQVNAYHYCKNSIYDSDWDHSQLQKDILEFEIELLYCLHCLQYQYPSRQKIHSTFVTLLHLISEMNLALGKPAYQSGQWSNYIPNKYIQF